MINRYPKIRKQLSSGKVVESLKKEYTNMEKVRISGVQQEIPVHADPVQKYIMISDRNTVAGLPTVIPKL